tara:strand:+ start:44548 stop:45213 length:666 start_codon:yes stop_codon:yes gene_type:complete
MYCRFYELQTDSSCTYAYKACQSDVSQHLNAPFTMKNSNFEIRDTLEECLKDLALNKSDGRIMRLVVPVIGSFNFIQSGCAARYWFDTSYIDKDDNHLTKDQLEAQGYIVSELYLGPFSLEHSSMIIDELETKIPYLGVIKFGNAYNVAQIIKIEPNEMLYVNNGKLHFNVSKQNFESMINEWHQTKNTTTSLIDYLNIPFEAFSIYASSSSKCLFDESQK